MSPLLRWSALAISIASSLSLAFSKPLSTYPIYNRQSSSSPLPLAPLIDYEHPHGTINNSYIVILKDDIPRGVKANHMNFLMSTQNSIDGGDAELSQVYDGHISGYAGRFADSVVEQIRKMPEVAYVEKDQIVRTQDVQKSAPWGLARISHRKKLTFSTFTKYLFNNDGGEGVNVYVIDTGINVNHVEFEGRAVWGKTIPENDVDDDGNGHGTHCAGTIASRKYGVAKKATVIAVKVLGSNGSGSMSDVVAGVVFAANDAKEKADASAGNARLKGSVANMSLGGGKSMALDDAVNKAVKNGLHFAVAAGNDNRDACSYSPAASELAVTVGASTLGDERAYFSNFGECVDVFGPGLNILSTFRGSKTATATLSGTSMASPHTAGILAYLLSIYPSVEFNPTFEPNGDLVPESLSLGMQSVLSSSPLSLYGIVHKTLPRFISSHLPPPSFLDILLRGEDDTGGAAAPIPKPTLSPAELKKALLALATAGVLAELPPKTPNLLIFNNRTDV